MPIKNENEVTYTERNIIHKISNTYNIESKDVEVIFNEIFNFIKEKIIEGNKIVIKNFGRFLIRFRQRPKNFLHKNNDNLTATPNFKFTVEIMKALKENIGERTFDGKLLPENKGKRKKNIVIPKQAEDADLNNDDMEDTDE